VYDCIDCIDGLVLYNILEDGTGKCRVPGPEACYENVGDETTIEGCMCHESCGTSCAGAYAFDFTMYGDDYYIEVWPDLEENCVDCPEGFELFPVWEDGTGFCLEPSVCRLANGEVSFCTCNENCHDCYGGEEAEVVALGD
jgi:hypothetical protein